MQASTGWTGGCEPACRTGSYGQPGQRMTPVRVRLLFRLSTVRRAPVFHPSMLRSVSTIVAHTREGVQKRR
jgi:hypothetical protein